MIPIIVHFLCVLYYYISISIFWNGLIYQRKVLKTLRDPSLGYTTYNQLTESSCRLGNLV